MKKNINKKLSELLNLCRVGCGVSANDIVKLLSGKGYGSVNTLRVLLSDLKVYSVPIFRRDREKNARFQSDLVDIINNILDTDYSVEDVFGEER